MKDMKRCANYQWLVGKRPRHQAIHRRICFCFYALSQGWKTILLLRQMYSDNSTLNDDEKLNRKSNKQPGPTAVELGRSIPCFLDFRAGRHKSTHAAPSE